MWQAGFAALESLVASSPRVAAPPPKKYPGQKNPASYAGFRFLEVRPGRPDLDRTSHFDNEKILFQDIFC